MRQFFKDDRFRILYLSEAEMLTWSGARASWGSMKSKVFGDAAQASKAADGMIKRWLKDGYEEVVPAPIPQELPAVAVLHQGRPVSGVAAHGPRAVGVGGVEHGVVVQDGKWVEVSTSKGFRAVEVDGQNLWAVGGSRSIAHTRGQEWTRLAHYKVPQGMNGIAQDHTGALWVGGEWGLFWSPDQIRFRFIKGIDLTVTQVVSTPMGILAMTEDPGLLYLGHKGKLRQLDLEAGGDLRDATMTPRGSVIVVGSDCVFRSEDRGASFRQVGIEGGVLRGVCAMEDGRVVVVGEAGLLWISNDDGRTYLPVPHDLGEQDLTCCCAWGAGVLVGGSDGLAQVGEVGETHLVAEPVDAALPDSAKGLLVAMQNEPANHDARRVYADFLMQHGHETQAGLIQVQCGLMDGDEAERNKLVRKQNKLLKDLAAEWGPGWEVRTGQLRFNWVTEDRYADTESLGCTFKGGMITGIESHPNVLAHQADWVLEHAPLLDSLTIKMKRMTPSKAFLGQLVEGSPCLRTLSLPAKRVWGEELARCAHTLRWLTLRGGNRGVLESLDASGTLRSIAEVDLYKWGLKSTDVGLLLSNLGQPETLLLNDSQIGAAGVEQLCASEKLSSVHNLGLYNNGIEADGVVALAASPTFSALQKLDLRSNRIGTQGPAALGASSTLGALRELVLIGNSLKREGIAGLTGPGLKLQTLVLQHTRLDDAAMAELVAAKDFCQSLRTLKLGSNKITNEGANTLAGCDALQGLEELDLHGNKINQTGWRVLKNAFPNTLIRTHGSKGRR